MKKKGLIISIFGSCIVACSSALLFMNQNSGMYAFASDDCEGNHYAELAPTFDNPGHREYWICCKHGEVSLTKPDVGTFNDQSDDKMIGGVDTHNPAYLPALNTTDYTVNSTSSSGKLTEKWTKSSSVGPDYVLTKTYDYGAITIKDYSSGKEVVNSYSYNTFNDAFEGIELSVDTSTSTMTFDVTKEGGYTFENVLIDIPSCTTNKCIFTGEPLTVIAPDGDKGDGISFSCSATTSPKNLMATAEISNHLSIIYPSTHTKASSKSGLKESFLTINEGASLTIDGYANGIWACYTPITVNGTLDVTASTQAVTSSSSSKNRIINVPDEHDVFFNGSFVRTGGNSSTDEIKTGGVKKIKIAPTTGPHHTVHTWAESWSFDESQHWYACTEATCEEVSDKAAHTFEWITDLDPTFEAKGSKHEECTICGYAKDPVEINELEHSYSTEWSSNDEQHWHSCTDTGYSGIEHGTDITDHTFEDSAAVDPTYTSVGHTASKTCTVCGKVLDGYEIPMLNETNYTREIKTENYGKKLTETWTLKNPSSIGKDSYVFPITYHYAFVTVSDYSSGSENTKNYTLYDFNSTFEGLNLSINSSTSLVTLEVTKTGGYTFNNTLLSFNSDAKNTVKITGEPLTINAPQGSKGIALNINGTDNSGALSHLIIDTDVSVIYPESCGTLTSYSGVHEAQLTVNSGASLTVTGFNNGIEQYYSNAITVNGELIIAANGPAIISTTSKARTINIAENLNLYFNGKFVQKGGSTTTTAISEAKARRVHITPETLPDEPEYDYDYTVMLYMCGSDLEAEKGSSSNGNYATKDLKEILSASKANDDVRFIVETGGTAGTWGLESSYLDGMTSISNTALQRWEVSGGKLKHMATLDTNLMATQSSLEGFLNWGLDNYSAERMGLILWNHGAGVNGVCSDDNASSSDTLLAHEVYGAVGNALADHGRDKFTWIGYDACLMACADVASVNADYFDYMVCSQENEPARGWAYDKWLPYIYNDSQVSNSVVFSNIVSSYNAQFTTTESTLSCLDLTKCETFIEEFETYSKAILAKFPTTTVNSTSQNFYANNIGAAFEDSEQFGVSTSYGSIYGLADFKDFITNMETYFPTVDNTALLEALDDMVLYNGCSKLYKWTPCGLNIFVAWVVDTDYPLQAKAYKGYNTENGTKLKTWADMNCNYSPVTWISRSK